MHSALADDDKSESSRELTTIIHICPTCRIIRAFLVEEAKIVKQVMKAAAVKK